MSRYLKLLSIAIAATALASVTHAAPIMTFDSAPATDGSGLTTAVSGATVIDFNDGLKPAWYSGDGGVVTGSVENQYAAPLNNDTAYLTVAYGSPSGSETIQLASSYNYFGLYWGSIDDYNTLAFYQGETLLSLLTGQDVIAEGAQLGDQLSPGSNRYVNFFFGNQSFDRIILSSSQYAFESDNHAFARVPAPGPLALLAVGLLGLGLVRRRRV